MLSVTTKEEKTPFLLPALEQPCRCFSMSELSSATDNFGEKWCIGHGGSGKVYKGKIFDGTTNTYAIKKLHFESDQGASEFWVEVEMLSRLRHCNILSLIGYSNEGKEMALVYEYMQNGTLYDQLYKKGTLLTWSQWLKICIGAARGLDYLHTGTGTQDGVIHRDVKSSNILLDQTYAAKIADFGLAKIGPTNQTHTYVSTRVKGTYGYMDPNYYHTGRLTRKSDVYAFGVVLVEVLSGRSTSDESLDQGLAIWAQDLIKQGKLSQIISSSLRDNISKSSLKEFSRIAAQCLISHPNQRPTMTEVVGSLDRALSFQERKASSTKGRITINNVWSLLTLKGPFELRSTVATQSKNGTETLEGQDENHSKPNLVNTSYLNPLIDTSASASTLDPTEAFTRFTKIKESIRISKMDGSYLDSSSCYESGGYAPSEEGENYGLDIRNPASNIPPSRFKTLEKKYATKKVWHNPERRLLFDCINSGMTDTVRPKVDIRICSNPLRRPMRSIRNTLRRDVIEKEQSALLHSQENEISDVGFENSLFDKWFDPVEELDSLVTEFGNFLFLKLVAESVFEFAMCLKRHNIYGWVGYGSKSKQVFLVGLILTCQVRSLKVFTLIGSVGF